LFPDIPEGTYVIVHEIGGVSQISNLTEIKQGNQSISAIEVNKGQSLDIGTLRVLVKN